MSAVAGGVIIGGANWHFDFTGHLCPPRRLRPLAGTVGVMPHFPLV